MVGETLQPQSRQLEFEDVWLASQVEPLQDNFDVLGKSSDEISEGEVSKETVVPCRWGEGRGGEGRGGEGGLNKIIGYCVNWPP